MDTQASPPQEVKQMQNKMQNKLHCPIMATMAMISDKWKVLILCKLRGGTLRFSELMKALEGVTQRVLTHQLRQLEADGLVHRKIYPEVPPRVEYSLTHLGRTLIPILDQMEDWARDHADELIEARRQQAAQLEAKALVK